MATERLSRREDGMKHLTKEMLRDAIAAIRGAGHNPQIEQRRHVHVVWSDGAGRKQTDRHFAQPLRSSRLDAEPHGAPPPAAHTHKS